MSPDYISVDAMRGWIETSNAPDPEADMLGRMIHAGKQQYILEATIPTAADTVIADYSAAQLAWCHQNEFNIWAHFVDEESFFKTDEVEIMSYLDDGPFTTGLSRESPPRVGQWLGWQIVRAFMEKNQDVTLEALLAIENPQAILDQSGYKPNR